MLLSDVSIWNWWSLFTFLFPLHISRLCEGGEGDDDKVVSDLRTELWEKERKLTDIRLEALSSAHRLEQLQEAMNNMQVCLTWSFSLFFTLNKVNFSHLAVPAVHLSSWFIFTCQGSYCNVIYF